MTEENSQLRKVLFSDPFRCQERFGSKGKFSQKIDTNHLKLFGLLHCAGTPHDKAEVLLTILYKGYLGDNTYITSRNKNLVHVFEKLCALATWELFEIAQRAGALPNLYTKVEIASLKG